MKFKNLEMTGFKSFSDKTSVLIEKGLTGIVGPNGCGKSNIVEAIRWCMGENSAKSMRGSGMEDVIFSGTSNLPAKNISEVSLFLENQENLIKYSTNRSRYKFEVNYLLNEQIKIKAYDEILLNINQQKNNIFDQNRIGLGVQYKPKENYALEIGYINWFQPMNSTTEYYNRHIIRITLLHYLKF